MPRTIGSKNRNYPAMSLKDALSIPRAIQDGASGRPVSKLALAKIVDRSPGASDFRNLLLASRAYGLTNGGVNADQFELSTLGNEATGGDEVVRESALRKAVMNIEPSRTFLAAYNGKKIPAPVAFKEFLVTNAAVPEQWADECMERILDDARFAGLLDAQKTGEYVDLSRAVTAGSTLEGESLFVDDGSDEPSEDMVVPQPVPVARTDAGLKGASEAAPRKVFIAHGKDHKPLGELKKILDQFKVKYAVAVDEPHAGRPISTKVANLMREECSSAIFIFTADERFLKDGSSGEVTEVWRPSENVVFELGAASVLYDRRIVIFKEKRVTFPSDYSDLGYIEFDSDQIGVKMSNLFAELIALDILEVRAKG